MLDPKQLYFPGKGKKRLGREFMEAGH